MFILVGMYIWRENRWWINILEGGIIWIFILAVTLTVIHVERASNIGKHLGGEILWRRNILEGGTFGEEYFGGTIFGEEHFGGKSFWWRNKYFGYKYFGGEYFGGWFWRKTSTKISKFRVSLESGLMKQRFHQYGLVGPPVVG